MGEGWVGFNGSYPFGSVAYEGAMEESTRAGDDAQPDRSDSARTPRRTTSALCPTRPARPQERREPESRSAHGVLCESALPSRTTGWFTKHIDSSFCGGSSSVRSNVGQVRTVDRRQDRAEPGLDGSLEMFSRCRKLNRRQSSCTVFSTERSHSQKIAKSSRR